jgi:hypothetical protein
MLLAEFGKDLLQLFGDKAAVEWLKQKYNER